LIGGGRDILFEDCRMRFMQIVSTTYTWEGHEDNLVTNFKLRRCIVTDSWAHNTTDEHSARPQGYYASETHGILVEECVFDHNGWCEAFADANANMYNHNIYLSTSNYGPIIIRGNILSRGSSHGLQLRSGGIAENNLFYGNAIGMNAGYTEYPLYNAENTYVRNNVVIAGRPQIPDDYSAPQSGALWGIWKQLINNYYCYNNIVCNVDDTRASNINPYVGQTANEFGTGNIAWNWVNNSEPEYDPGWSDPDRTIASYNTSIGNPATFEDFIERARNRPVNSWPEAYSANSVNNYIRAGFLESGNTEPEVSFNYPTPSQTPSMVQFTSSVYDPDGDELNYAWIFQDVIFDAEGNRALIDKGYSAEIDPSYTFNYPGTYAVSLTVSDNRGGITTYSEEITVNGNNPPVALVNLDQTSGDAPLVVEFDASGSSDQDGDGLTYFFDFGDGNTESTEDAIVTHTYNPGDYTQSFYTYSLYVSDGAANSFVKTGQISVTDPTKEVRNYAVEADALLDADDPDANYGTEINSLISQLDKHGIFRFNYTSNSDTILKAELYIPVKYGSNPCAVKYIADDSWVETEITWNSQPAASQEALAAAVYEDDWAIFDITDKITAETDEIISILLYETADGWQEFRYRETSWTEAYLRIEVELE
jgi:PKD repeat protein